jgi:glutamate-ammonia-ligase adenylyltransferase
MAEGRLYEVDMRLRPSGRQGPVATALAAFRSYQMEEAWTWEHLALTRARPVAGSAELGAAVDEVRLAVLAEKGQGSSVLSDVADMRRRLAEAKPGAGLWDMRAGPGRLQEIELVAQTAALRSGSAARRPETQLAAGRRAGWPAAGDAEALLAAYRLGWRLHSAGRLLTDGLPDPDRLGPAATAMLLREAGAADVAALSERLESLTATAAATIDRLLSAG